MTDEILVVADKKTLSGVTRLNTETSIYNAAATFDLEITGDARNILVPLKRIQVLVNGVTAIDGIIDRRSGSFKKDSTSISINGRDLMGLVVDTCIDTFTTLKNKTLMQVAQLYLSKIPYVNNLNLTFIDNAATLDVAQEYVQPQPGMTVFELLSGIAAARGIHFYMRPDGNIVFGKPQGFGTRKFSVVSIKGATNNPECSFFDDYSKRFSSVTVTGQVQSTDSVDADKLNVKATAVDEEFTSFKKPLVVETNLAGVTVAKQARMIIEQQRFDGFQIRYTMPGFSQRGNVWQTDSICTVNDYRIPFTGDCLVYGRSLQLQKKQFSTVITLGKLGIR